MSHKLLITLQNEDELTVIENAGAEILVNYGNSVLVRTDDETDAEALAAQGLEVAELPGAPVKVASMAFEFSDALAAEAAAPMVVDNSRRTYYLVQFIGPVKGEWLREAEAQGVRLQSSLPGFSALVSMFLSDVAQVEALPFVEAVTPYRPAMKVSPKLRSDTRSELGLNELATFSAETLQPTQPTQIEIAIFPDTSSAEIASVIRDGGGTIFSEQPNKIIAAASATLIADLAQKQGIQAILPFAFPELHNDIAREIMEIPADATIGGLTLEGNNQIVAVADSGLDTGNIASIHADFAGRVVAINSLLLDPAWGPYIVGPLPDDGSADTNSGHGTHVAGSVLGNGQAAVTAGAATVPRGTAPAARLYFQATEQQVNWKSIAQLNAEGLAPPFSPWPPPSVGLHGLPLDLANLFSPAYSAGARIHTNSWGAPIAGQYNANAREVDAFLWNNRDMLVCFSAGNAGEDTDGDGIIDPDSIGSPGTAKNCLTVGATENNRPSGSLPTPGADGNWADVPLGGHVSDNVDGMAAFSSRGPTDDGRIKPDVVAPGTNILSTRSSRAVESMWGEVTPNTDPLNGLYVWSGGTSMATPLVAGAAALIRQHLVEQRGHHQDGVKPSGALIKAFLVNGTERIPGQFVNEIPANWPNGVAGFGRVNLIDSITPPRLGQALFADEPDYAVATDDIRTFEVNVVDTSEPLRITLVWTDAPAPIGTGGIINQLYLQVRQPDGAIVNGDTTAFPIVSNNVQQIQIDAPVSGTYQIRVRGVSVTQQAPGASLGSAADPHQDYALVVSNGMGMSTQPVSIAQAIDTTGSMGFYGYMEPAKERAKQLVDFMRVNDKTAVVEFSQRPGVTNDGRTVYPLNLLGAFNPDWTDAHTAIDGLLAQGRTPIGAGLQEAWNQLASEPTSRPRAIVLLSDGFNNASPDPTAVLPGIPSDVPIFTIALGPASLTTTLSAIASSRPNGAYYAVESDEDIYHLHEIYAQVQALAAGASLIGLSSVELDSQETAVEEMHVDPDAREASFTLTWKEGTGNKEMSLTVVAPDGTEFNEASPAAIVRRGTSYIILRVGAPQPGPWKVVAINRGSHRPVRATLSGAVQSDLNLSVETAKVGREFLVLTARLQRSQQPLDDAHVFARITLPTRSVSEILDEFGDEIWNIDLPDELQERGLSEEQLLHLKLTLFMQKFRDEEGGLFGHQAIEIPLLPQGNGRFSNDIPLAATGNTQIEIVAHGETNGMLWERRATQALHVPEKVKALRDVAIKEIFVRRNRRWHYTIIGVSVANAAGDPLSPDEGISVELSLALGSQRIRSGALPYYRRGQYYIWRFKTPLLSSNGDTVPITATVTRDDKVVASAHERLRL